MTHTSYSAHCIVTLKELFLGFVTIIIIALLVSYRRSDNGFVAVPGIAAMESYAIVRRTTGACPPRGDESGSDNANNRAQINVTMSSTHK